MAVGLSILLVLAMSSAPFVLIGLLVWWAALTNKRRIQSWAEVAARMRLHFTGQTIEGVLHGQHVRVATETRGSGKNKSTYTVVSSTLKAPLDLGLRVTRSGWLGDLFERGRDIPVGHPAFDQVFRVSGDEDHRVRAAMSPPLQRLLFDQLQQGSTFALHDQGMRIETNGTSDDGRWLSWALEVVARGASKLERTRPSIPTAGALAVHQHTWRRYAQQNGLHMSVTPLCLWGRMENCEVYVYTVRTGVRRYQLDVSLRFREPLHVGLHIGPKGVFDKIAIFFGSQDQLLGDPMFDHAFRVRSADVERSQQLLTGAIRGQLLRLHGQLGPITVNDDGVSVRLPYVPHDPSMVPRVVHEMVGLNEALQRASKPDTEIGPYR